jgi:short-subunit dehydrogenase involved in D-alanine esterification of teichoic acids
MKFQEKKIIIAGGTSGIGLATASFFANEKAQVTVTGRNTEKLKLAQQAGLKTAHTDSSDRTALNIFFKNHGQS